MKYFLGYILLIFLFVPSSLEAHGLATTQQQADGDYILEFEYDTLGQVVAGELTAYNFELLDKVAGQPQEYERVFVKINKLNGPTVFSGNFAQVDVLGRKSSRANIVLSESGPYNAELTFFKDSIKLASSTFGFDVREDLENSGEKNFFIQYWQWGVMVFLALVVVILGTALGKRKF